MYSYLLACSNEWMARNGISSGGDAIFRCQELRTAASLRMYRRAGWKKDGRRRNPIGWGRRRRREKGGGTAEPHQFRPPPQSCNAREEGERERTKRYSALGFVSNRFRRVRGPKRVTQWLEFGSVPGEFGPNSGLNFYTLPNAGIRVRILEFRILSPILCI
jgi:hypothetical protein